MVLGAAPLSPAREDLRTHRQTDAACLPRRLRARGRSTLTALAKELDKTHPGAAGSLREGMHETLTVLRLDVPPTLARTLRSTNAVQSMISVSPDHSREVNRWRDGQMALRWCATGMVEASKQVRRVNGHLHLPTLRTTLEQYVAARSVSPDCNTQTVSQGAAWCAPDRQRSFTKRGTISRTPPRIPHCGERLPS